MEERGEVTPEEQVEKGKRVSCLSKLSGEAADIVQTVIEMNELNRVRDH